MPSTPLLDPRDHLIVALDFPSAELAFAVVAQLEGAVRWFKVGLELFLAAGPPVVLELKRLGFSVFLDLKLHDIPNTVASAVRSVARLGPDLLTVHAGGGPAMLAAAAQAAASLGSPQLLAVTVLTSMDGDELAAAGVNASPAEQVLRLATLTAASGIAGLVCSPEEAAMLRAMLDPALVRPMFLVTPGIRPQGASAADQKRIATPAAALAAGADMLVVGRPITQSPDPLAAARAVLAEMQFFAEG